MKEDTPNLLYHILNKALATAITKTRIFTNMTRFEPILSITGPCVSAPMTSPMPKTIMAYSALEKTSSSEIPSFYY